MNRSSNYHKEIFIYPGEKEQVKFWTKKWGVSVDQLYEAILQTGSVNVREIRGYLVNKGWLFSFSHLLNYFRSRNRK